MNNSLLKNKHFNLSIKDSISDCIILERKKNLNGKPPYYIFDLTRKCYISSLKPTNKEDVFNFDVILKNEERTEYLFTISETGKIQVSNL